MQPGILRVSERASERIHADSADIEFKVAGESFVLGQMAAQRCAELKVLVEALKQQGVTDEDIDVRSVSLKQSKGRLLSSSSAEYSLVVHIEDLDKLPVILGAIQSSAHVELDRVRWGYDKKQEVMRVLAARAMGRAMAKAEAMAAAAGQRVTGVRVAADDREAQIARLQQPSAYELSDEGDAEVAALGFGARGMKKKASTLHIGTSYSASQEVRQTVMLEVYLAPLGGPDAPAPPSDEGAASPPAAE